jgi:hypothetical protein
VTTDPQSLLEILAYKRQVLEQLLTVSSIFGGFAVTGTIALRSDGESHRSGSIAFFAMAVASVAFIFATAFDAIWLPVSHNVEHASPATIRTIIALGDSVAWAVIAGTASLATAGALLGFARSRMMGLVIMVITLGAVAVFAVNMWILATAI